MNSKIIDDIKLMSASIPVSEQIRAFAYAAMLGIELSHHFEESGSGCDALYADGVECMSDTASATEVRFVITSEDDGLWTLSDIGRVNPLGVIEEQAVLRFQTLPEAIQCIALRKVERTTMMM